MEIKGEKAYLNKSERAATKYPKVVPLPEDYLRLRKELDHDVESLAQLRADDETTLIDRVKSLNTHGRLVHRSQVLESILKNAGIEMQAQIMLVQAEEHLAHQPDKPTTL